MRFLVNRRKSLLTLFLPQCFPQIAEAKPLMWMCLTNVMWFNSIQCEWCDVMQLTSLLRGNSFYSIFTPLHYLAVLRLSLLFLTFPTLAEWLCILNSRSGFHSFPSPKLKVNASTIHTLSRWWKNTPLPLLAQKELLQSIVISESLDVNLPRLVLTAFFIPLRNCSFYERVVHSEKG